jgi:hypothetical protein
VARIDAHRRQATTQPLDGSRRDEVQEGLDPTEEVEVVVDDPARLAGRDPVEELQRADSGLDPVRGEDRLRDRGVVAGCDRIRGFGEQVGSSWVGDELGRTTLAPAVNRRLQHIRCQRA